MTLFSVTKSRPTALRALTAPYVSGLGGALGQDRLLDGAALQARKSRVSSSGRGGGLGCGAASSGWVLFRNQRPLKTRTGARVLGCSRRTCGV